MHFLSVLFFTSDSVHLFEGGELLLRTDFKRCIPSDLEESTWWEVLPPPPPIPPAWVGVLWDPPREEGEDYKISLKKEWSLACTLRSGEDCNSD